MKSKEMINLKLGIFSAMWYNVPFDKALKIISDLGFEAIELPAQKDNPHLDIDAILESDAKRDEFLAKMEKYELTISGLSNHVESQLVLGPHNKGTEWMYKGDKPPTPENMSRWGMERVKKTAQAAKKLGVPVVNGFCGVKEFDRFFPFPSDKPWDEMGEEFAEKWDEILDVFSDLDLKYGMEPHPNEFVYNLETAQQSIELLNGRKEWGFNLDPANLIWQDIDPVYFIKEFGDRIYHFHAKDCEVLEHNVRWTGRLSKGEWTSQDRGFRFRIPGWGDVPWKRVLTELRMVDYDYVLSIEYEDPTMSQEDGIHKAVDFIKPLIINKPFGGKVWI